MAIDKELDRLYKEIAATKEAIYDIELDNAQKAQDVDYEIDRVPLRILERRLGRLTILATERYAAINMLPSPTWGSVLQITRKMPDAYK